MVEQNWQQIDGLQQRVYQLMTSQSGKQFVEIPYKPGPPDGDRYPDFTNYMFEEVQIASMTGLAEKHIEPPEIGDFSKAWEQLEEENGSGYVDSEYGIIKRVKGEREGSFPDKSPRGYTWHHVQEGEKLQLVDKNVHAIFTHKGGASISRD
ncbi:hypothetical protein C942_02400 [Photobacterium marinum]|uniref:HNH endonuclease n=1 Tax=Photobacterium marinum TaxID=1056511 RepID=L8JAX4_9GAMM|nr:HNH endonuclease [Photobacterium marinum]ELR64587.1 hypothetical protein C942_02400 [Photobacterium marinum]